MTMRGSFRAGARGRPRGNGTLADTAPGKQASINICRGAGLIFCAFLAACAGRPPATADAGVEGAAYVERNYKIGVDDRVEVSVWRNPDLSVTVPVRPDGKISVPLIGDVPAGGRTPEEVATQVRQKLADYIREPNVAVIVTELRSHEFLSRVRVTGAVHTPRSMNYRQGMTVLDAVLEAGGINDFASPNHARLYRAPYPADDVDDDKGKGKGKGKGKTQIYSVKLGDILTMGRLETNYSLLPGDVITVPERLF